MASSSAAVPETPVPEERRVHFSSTTVTLGAGETRALGGHHDPQSQSESQADDPFIGSGGNIIANTRTQVCFIFFSMTHFLKFIIGRELQLRCVSLLIGDKPEGSK